MDTVTSTSLLEAIRDRCDDQAWIRFTDRYRPMLVAFALRMDLSLSDAQDLSQEALLGFMQSFSMGKFDRSKGKLRSWLFGIAHRKVVDFRRKRAREFAIFGQRADSGFWATVASRDNADAVWEEEWRQGVFRACVHEISQKLSPRTFSAFELYFLREWPVQKVAEHLKMTPGSVYKAKHKAMNEIRMMRDEIEEIW